MVSLPQLSASAFFGEYTKQNTLAEADMSYLGPCEGFTRNTTCERSLVLDMHEELFKLRPKYLRIKPFLLKFNALAQPVGTC